MRTCRLTLLTCLTLAALPATRPAFAGGIAASASAGAPAAALSPLRLHSLAPRRFNFTPISLRELVKARLPASPASFLPAGWEPVASSSYTGDLRGTTIDLGLRHEFSGHQSAQLGARITVLDYISIDNSGRFALGNHGSKIHGLVGLTYRY
jgi:hypothetical protein